MKESLAFILGIFLQLAIPRAANFQPVACEGMYPHHLQGLCTNQKDSIYWPFTTRLVKTDRTGKVVNVVDFANHHGDLCFREGKIYVAVNLGKFDAPKGNADSWVYVYDASDLSLLAKHKAPEVFHGAGGIAIHEGRFLVVGGFPDNVNENFAYEYDRDFNFVKQHTLAGGHTHLGIQTAAFADGPWWLGCYRSRLLARPTSLREMEENIEMSNVFGFGAVGNGVADDTAALQHTLDAGDGVLRLNKGTYRITKPLVLDLTKTGFGAVRGEGGISRIMMAGARPAIRVMGDHQGMASPSSVLPHTWDKERFPTINGIEIVGEHLDAVGIELRKTMKCVISQVLARRAIRVLGRRSEISIASWRRRFFMKDGGGSIEVEAFAGSVVE